MSYWERQRLADIQAAIDAIRPCLRIIRAAREGEFRVKVLVACVLEYEGWPPNNSCAGQAPMALVRGDATRRGYRSTPPRDRALGRKPNILRMSSV